MEAAIRTNRPGLITATRAILESDLSDRSRLARLLRAAIPAAWPPPLMDGNAIREFIRMCSETTGPVFAAWYWVLDDPAAGGRAHIGNRGTLQVKNSPKSVVLGYSVPDEYRNRGYATEAVSALVPWTVSRPQIHSIIATTFPDLIPSIRVPEKTGFYARTDRVPYGSADEEGSVCYQLEKP